MNCQWNCRSGRLQSLATFCKTIGTVGWLHVFSERWGNKVVSSCNVRCTKDCPASHEKYEGRGWRRCHRNGTQPISSRIRTYHQRQTAVGYQLLCTCLRGAQSHRAMCSRFREFGIGCCSPLKIDIQTLFKHISDSIFNIRCHLQKKEHPGSVKSHAWFVYLEETNSLVGWARSSQWLWRRIVAQMARRCWINFDKNMQQQDQKVVGGAWTAWIAQWAWHGLRNCLFVFNCNICWRMITCHVSHALIHQLSKSGLPLVFMAHTQITTSRMCFLRCQVCDAFQSYIWEPVLVKESALNAATEAACLILSIDETVKNPQLGWHPKQPDHLSLPFCLHHLLRVFLPVFHGFPTSCFCYEQGLKRTDDVCGFCGCVPLRQSEKPQGGPKGKGKGKAPCTQFDNLTRVNS